MASEEHAEQDQEERQQPLPAQHMAASAWKTKKEMMKKYKDAGGHEPTEPGVHEASMTDTKIESLISSLHQFMRFAYEKGRGYWENIPLADHVSFDRNELIDTVFEKFGESGSRNNVRKTYGNTVVSNNEFSQ